MAGSFGYAFIFFSAIFYLFLGMVLTMGAGDWLTSSVVTTQSLTVGNYSSNVTTTGDLWDTTKYILQNPFSSISWLAWLSVGILITDIYIIITSVIP